MARFIRRGITKIFFLKTVADPAKGPTRQEIQAGKDITCWPSEISGFTTSSNSVDVPDLCSKFPKKIPGAMSMDDSSMTMYEDLDSEEIETLFPENEEGYIYFMPKGDKPTSKSGELWKVQVASTSRNYTVGEDPATLVVNFTVTEAPIKGLAIPAAA